jgi:hypothetical protein
MLIEDWEVGALFWKLVDQGTTRDLAAEKVREKFLHELCGPNKDTYFYVGTILAHPKSWVVIGVFYPKKPRVLTQRKRPTQRKDPNMRLFEN